MLELDKLLKKVCDLDVDDILFQIWSSGDVQDKIVALNTEGEQTSQLFELGEDSDGKSLGNYAPSTIEGTANFKGKKEKGQRFDHITLKDEGFFYASFRVTPLKRGFRITANPRRGDSDLFDDFGVEIVGLQKRNILVLLDHIEPLFNKEFEKRLLR